MSGVGGFPKPGGVVAAPAWGAITGQIGDQIDLVAALAAAGGNADNSQQLTGIVSGLGVSYLSGLDFEMVAGACYLNGTQVTAAAQTVTLDAADASNPRIDVLYVDDSGTFGVISGTPAASPSQPSVDPTAQLYLTFVLVPAAATSLDGIVNVDIYREGSEWTPTAVGSGFTVNSTNNPFAGTKCVEGTNVSAGAYVKFVTGSPITFDGDGNLTLRLRSKAAWNGKRWLTLQWFSGGVARGAQVSLKSGSFGFDASSTGAYQFVVISKALFQIPAGSQIDQLRVVDAGGSIGFYLDDVILQTTGDVTGGSAQALGITQADADARYAQRSQNLEDLTDKAAARSNLGLTAVAASGSAADLTTGTLPSGRISFAASGDVQAGTNTTKPIHASALAGSAAPQTLTDGATINWDMSAGYNAKVTLGGNRTLATPTNPIAGLTYSLNVIQDGTGSRTMTWPSAFDWGTAGAPTLTATASKRDRITLFYTDAATPKFDAFLSGKGFS